MINLLPHDFYCLPLSVCYIGYCKWIWFRTAASVLTVARNGQRPSIPTVYCTEKKGLHLYNAKSVYMSTKELSQKKKSMVQMLKSRTQHDSKNIHNPVPNAPLHVQLSFVCDTMASLQWVTPWANALHRMALNMKKGTAPSLLKMWLSEPPLAPSWALLSPNEPSPGAGL